MRRRKQDWRLFAFFGIVVGIGFIALGICAMVNGAPVPFGVGIAIMGIAIFIGAIVAAKSLGNANLGKKDESITVRYQMYVDGYEQTIYDVKVLQLALENMTDNQEILIKLTPEYFGLATWRFVKRKGYYLSFVEIHKKDKTLEYFTMPNQNAKQAMAPFAEVFEKHYAVNTSNLIDMKRYKAVCEYYNIV